MKTLDFKQILVGVGATLILFWAGQVLGPLGTFGFVACPVPVLYLMICRQPLSAVLVAAGSALLVGALMGADVALQYLGIFALGPLALGRSLSRNEAWDRSLTKATLVVFGIMVVGGALVAALRGESLPQMIEVFVAHQVSQARIAYEAMELTPEQLLQMQEVADSIAVWLPRLFPSLFWVGIGMVNMVSLSLARRLPGVPGRIAGPDFTAWKAPEKLVWSLIVAGFAVAAPEGWWTVWGVNVLIAVLPIYFVQGMAIIASIMRKKGLPKAFRVIVYCTVVLINPLPMLVTGVGLFDIWADFRRPRIVKE